MHFKKRRGVDIMMKKIKNIIIKKVKSVNRGRILGLLTVFSLLFCHLFSPAISLSSQGDFAVITNPACPNVSKDELKLLFLGYKKILGGYPVELFVSRDEAVTSDFIQNVLGLKTSEFNSHWLKRALSGEGAGPKRLTDEEIISRIKNIQCAIGVISSEKATPDIKILLKGE